jgi:hypothetical protein
MKTETDALGTAENMSRSGKCTLRSDLRVLLPHPIAPQAALRTSSKRVAHAQNKKTGPDAPFTAENEPGSEKHENQTRRLRYRRRRVRARKTIKRETTPPVPPKTSLAAQNMKTGPDALGTAENMSGSGKQENKMRRTRYRRKQVRERKT